MTTPQLIPDSAVLVAIDIAKSRNDVLIEIPGQSRRRRLIVPNARAEHDRFIAWRLVSAGFTTRLISSMALARTREGIHNGWDKNDPKDAQVILHMLRGLSPAWSFI